MKSKNPKGVSLYAESRFCGTKAKMRTKSSSPSEKGVSLYLSLVMMGILLSLALGLNSILLGQAKTTQEIGNSVFAFYAAETGIEKNLYNGSQGTGSLENGATYIVTTLAPGIKSVGTYQKTSRAIYISR